MNISPGENVVDFGVDSENYRLYVTTTGGKLLVLDADRGTILETLELLSSSLVIPRKSSAKSGVYAVNALEGTLSLLSAKIGEIPVLALRNRADYFALDVSKEANEVLFAFQAESDTLVSVYAINEYDFTYKKSTFNLPEGQYIQEIAHFGSDARAVCSSNSGFVVYDFSLIEGPTSLFEEGYHGAASGNSWQLYATSGGGVFGVDPLLGTARYNNTITSRNFQYFGARYISPSLEEVMVLDSSEIYLVSSYSNGSAYFGTNIGGVLLKNPSRDGREDGGGLGGGTNDLTATECSCTGTEIVPSIRCICTTSTRTFTFEGENCPCAWTVDAPPGWEWDILGCSVTLYPKDLVEGGMPGKIKLSVVAGQGSTVCRARKTITATKVEISPPAGSSYIGAMGGQIRITPPRSVSGCGIDINAFGDAGNLASTGSGTYGFNVSGENGGSVAVSISGDLCNTASYSSSDEDIPGTTSQDPENPEPECSSTECQNPPADKGWATSVLFNGIPSPETVRPELFADGSSGDVEVGLGDNNSYFAKMRPQIQTYDGGCTDRELYGKLIINLSQSANGGAVALVYNGNPITTFPFVSPTLYIGNHTVGDVCEPHTWHYIIKKLEIFGVTGSPTKNDVIITVEFTPNTPGASADPLHKQLIRCTVSGFKRYKSLVFLRADDPVENESWNVPSLAQKIEGGIPPSAVRKAEQEKWLEAAGSVWNSESVQVDPGITLHASDSMPVGGGAKSRLVRVSYPTGPTPVLVPRVGEFSVPYVACTEATETRSCEKNTGGSSGSFAPVFKSGTRPGKFKIGVELKDSGLSSWQTVDSNGGELFVSRIDARGVGGSADSAFPAFTEVIPKRAGTVSAPVIAIVSGGVIEPGENAAPMSLYGTDLDGKNVWQLKAIATSPGNLSQTIPEGYSVTWLLDGGQILIGTAESQLVTVKFEAGSAGQKTFQPRLEIRSASGDLMGAAEIHNIVVEGRPTNHVGAPSEMVSEWFGATFAIENEGGQGGLPVDVFCRVSGPEIGEGQQGSLWTRGRISPDGYPQNQYWGGANDQYDLGQVVTIGANSAIHLKIQGYKLESASPNDLTLEVYGQGQREQSYPNSEDDDEAQLATYDFFEYAGDLGTLPSKEDRFRVVVSWEKIETETITSCYPVVMAYAYPEIEFDMPELSPGEEFVIPSDHLAYSNQTNVSKGSNYKVIDGVPGTVNLSAFIDWPAFEVSSDYFSDGISQPISLMWHITAFANNKCTTPKVWDLYTPPVPPAPPVAGSEDYLISKLNGLSSEVHIDYKTDIPIPGGAADSAPIGRAKAGDQFWLSVHSKHVDPSQMQEFAETGRVFWHDITLRIEHGVYRIHVTKGDATVSESGIVEPANCLPAGFNPQTEFDIVESPMSRFGNGSCVWTTPIRAWEKKKLEVYFFDRFMNPIPNMNVNWGVSGAGSLLEEEPSDNIPTADFNSVENSSVSSMTNSDGLAEIWYQMEGYPSCPWQEQGERAPAFITCNAYGLTSSAIEPFVGDTVVRVPIAPVFELALLSEGVDLPGLTDLPSRVFRNGAALLFDGPHDISIDSSNDYIRLIFKVTAAGFANINNYPVSIKSMNGRLIPISRPWEEYSDGGKASGIIKTNTEGYVIVHLFPNRQLQLTERESGGNGAFFAPIEVTATIDDRVVRVSTDFVTTNSIVVGASGVSSNANWLKARWVDGSDTTTTKLRVDNPLLAHDIIAGQNEELVEIETLFEPSDSSTLGHGVSSGLDADGVATNFLQMVVSNRSLVEITGAPGKVLRVDLGRATGEETSPWQNPAGVGPQLNFDFNEILTPEYTTSSDLSILVAQNVTAAVSPNINVVNGGGHAPGRNSFLFDGFPGSIVSIPSSSSVIDPNSTPGQAALEISFWLKTDQFAGTLVERSGQYSIVLLSSGHVRVSVGATEVDTAEPIASGWNYVEVRLSTNRLKISLGPNPYALDSNFPRIGGGLPIYPGPISPSTADAVVGEGYEGELDDLYFSNGGIGDTAAELDFSGIGTYNAAAGTLTLDSFGNGSFYIRVLPQPSGSINAQLATVYTFEVFGSSSKKGYVYSLPKKQVSELKAVQLALLYGTDSLVGLDLDQQSIERRIAAYASDSVPLLGNLRALYLECYKFSTGCDAISKWNIGFAIAGLAIEIITVGIASPAVKAGAKSAKGVLTKYRGVAKVLARELSLGVVVSFALVETLDKIGKEVSELANADPAPVWFTAARDTLSAIKDWLPSLSAVNPDPTSNEPNPAETINRMIQSKQDLYNLIGVAMASKEDEADPASGVDTARTTFVKEFLDLSRKWQEKRKEFGQDDPLAWSSPFGASGNFYGMLIPLSIF